MIIFFSFLNLEWPTRFKYNDRFPLPTAGFKFFVSNLFEQVGLLLKDFKKEPETTFETEYSPVKNKYSNFNHIEK